MQKIKTKNKFALFFVLLAFIFVSAILGGAFQAFSRRGASAQVHVEVSKEVATEYAFGDLLTLPECAFDKDGKKAVGVVSLQFPDGTQTKEKEVTLNQSGSYLLKYIATIDGKTYTQEYPFKVVGKLASYTSNKTTMEYGRCTHLGANSNGLMVKIANGDALTFDHVFDMTEVTMSDKLLEGFVVPNVQGAADFARMVFTFTDVEDPNVKLVYYGNFHNDSNAYGLTFFTAAGNGQVHCGLEHVGKLHVGSTLGCMVPHSFVAMDTGLYYGAQMPTPAAPDSKTFCISYDYKLNQAWAGGKIVSDLDDSNYYDSLWFGFPSGKAKLTISALNYNDASANMCITSILGVDLSAESYVDDKAPAISVDNIYEVMPNAVVGGSYPVPSATARDEVNGQCDVTVSVWHNLGMESQKMVDIADGRFAVSEVGTYAIVYEAKDYSGNIGREVLWVRAYLSQYIPKLSVQIDESFEKEVFVGTVQRLPQATVSGGCGDYTISYSITKGKAHCEIIDGEFCLEEVGEWTLTCTAVDYVGNTAVAVCALNGVVSDEPVIITQPTFPAAYISGSSYTLPILHAYDYSSGAKVEKLCSVTVEYDGKMSTYQAGESFIPTVNNHGDKVKIAYICDGVTLTESQVPTHIVFGKEKIPGNTDRYREVIHVDKYFYTDADLDFANNTQLGDIGGLTITANTALESAKTTFINPQMASAFSLDFLTVPNRSKFAKLVLTLTDSENAGISVKAVLSKNEGQTLMTVGDTSLTLALDFDASIASAYNIGYLDGKLIVNTTTAIQISKTENGEVFNGFPSGKIVFDLELCEAEQGAAIFLHKICGINVNNKQDNKGPFIATAGGNAVTNAFKDSVYTVKGIIAADFLCPNVTTSLTVLTPNGEVAKSVDGIPLQNVDATKDYNLLLAEYGEYYVAVKAQESGWKDANESTYEYLITVVDGERPTITFKGKFASELKVGNALVIPEYQVSDNFTSEENIAVMIVITNPKGLPIYLYGEEKAVRCEYAGVYKVQIFVCDEMGNLTTFETNVTVK